MSSIFKISEAFQKLLATGAAVTVELKDPTLTAAGSVSLWLYQIVPDEYSRNAATPILQEATSGSQPRRRSAVPPLGINLCYLVTPLISDTQSAHDTLGQLLLTIHENSIFTVRDTNLGIDELIRVSLPGEQLEDRLKLWDSLRTKPYQLSFVCHLRTVRLFSTKLVEDYVVVGGSSKPIPEEVLP